MIPKRPHGWFMGFSLLLAGCSSAGSNPLGIFPEGHQLSKTTRAMRKANPLPLPLPRELAKQMASPYVVEPGDILLVQPADFDSPVRIPGDQPVLPDGSIHLGRFGRVIVAGQTLEHIEAMVRDQVARIVKDAGPITVRVVSRQSKVFYVLGEVNSPGAYPLSGRETILDALLVAGGINSKANAHKITLTRPSEPEGCRSVLPIHYEDIVQLGDTSTNYQIAAGDRIFVPSKCFLDELTHHLGGKKSAAHGNPHIPCTCAEECMGGSCSAWQPACRP